MSLDSFLAGLTDRCASCGFHVPTMSHARECSAGRTAKAKGQAIATAAHPGDRAAVEAAIRQLAATGRPFSSNDARPLHGVKGPVVGATFTALAKTGLIRRIGYEPSTDPDTHAHPVATWQGAA